MGFYTNVSQVGNKIYHRWVDDDGKRHEEFTSFCDIDLFTPTRNETPFKSFDGSFLKRTSFAKIADAKKFIKDHDGISNMKIHGNRNWYAQFIAKTYPTEISWDMSKIVVANIDIETRMVWDDGTHGFPEPDIAPAEVTAITVEINGQYWVFGSKEYTKELPEHVTHFYCENEFILLDTFLKLWERKKPDLIVGWNIEGFDIPYLINRITNILGQEHAARLSPARRFLKNRAINIYEKTLDNGNTVIDYIIYGLGVCDLLKLYKFYTFKLRERYSLDFIGYIELGQKKLDYSQYGNLDDLYAKDYNTYIDYNIRDVELVGKLDDKLKLISLAMSLTYQAKIRHDDHFFQVRMWDAIIYNKLMDNNVVIPPMRSNTKTEKYMGAVVFEPQVGLHDWVVSADLDGLYPSLMRHYNISPEKQVTRQELEWIDNHNSKVLLEHFHPTRNKVVCKVEDFIDGKHLPIHDAVKNLNLSLTANGVLYRKDSQGFLAQLMEEIYFKRKAMKRKMLDAEQEVESIKRELHGDKDNIKLNHLLTETKNKMAKYKTMQMSYKTLLNSCYGALGNEYGRWYNVDMAESITISGQLSIQWIQRKINAYLNKLLKTGDVNYIVAGDTDSFYMTLAEFVNRVVGDRTVSKEKIVDMIDGFFEEKIQPIINDSYQELSEYMNSFEQQMIMSREVIADRGFWRAKKNYALNVYNSEGVSYDEPKLKIMGIEAIKSSTPEICRDAIKESLRIVLQESEESLHTYIKKFQKEFYAAAVEDIAFPRGISNIEKWDNKAEFGFISRTPIHVRGSLSYNRKLQKQNLIDQYRLVRNGDKIKFIYMKIPNPLHSNVISFPDILPSEFEVDRYIDYALQYKVSFIQPVESIIGSIGWSTEKRNTLF